MPTRTRTDPPADPVADSPPDQGDAAPPPASTVLYPSATEEAVAVPWSSTEYVQIPGGVAAVPGRLPEVPESAYGPDAEPLRDDYPLTVWEAVAEVTRRIGAVEKGRTASQGGSYKYRGIDDVLTALHPILGAVGLVLLPGQIVREAWETRSTAAGGTLNVARLLVEYVLVGPDGSRMTGQAWGEGGDAGDKATQKAASQAYKTFAFQTFSIPTEESSRDEPDATNPPARPFTAEEHERAERALTAAQATTTVEELAGVRHRALALLDVPVRFANGSTTPLGLLIDEHRRKIETAGAPT